MSASNNLKSANRLERDFFSRQTKLVAEELLGTILVSNLGNVKTSGLVVETEAYLPKGDSACHAAKHRTARTEVMFGPAGIAYVYPIHAKHCFNVVTELPELGCAVLIRALEPLDGIETMELRRGLSDRHRLTTGPACLCQSLGIDRASSQLDLTQSREIWFESRIDAPSAKIKSSHRIGVTSAKTRRLRFYISGNEYVSGPRKMKV